jgi:hypothetical protein
MKPKKDPIKPSKTLNKKPNFKKEKLDDDPSWRPRISVRCVYGQYDPLDIEQDYFLSSRERMRTSTELSVMIQQYETEVVGIDQMRTQQEVENLYGQLGHPIGISSRQRQNTDGSLDLLGYDLVNDTPTPRGRLLPLTVQGGEQMMYEASTWVTLNKKKTRWGKMKDYFSSIYKRWRRVG